MMARDIMTLTALPVPFVSLLVVSYGQGHQVRDLLSDLHTLATDIPSEVTFTLNLAEDECFIEAAGALPLRVVRNTEVNGFGANHNAAFAASQGNVFVIVNPDIQAQGLRLGPLVGALKAGAESVPVVRRSCRALERRQTAPGASPPSTGCTSGACPGPLPGLQCACPVHTSRLGGRHVRRL
jgi:hypothetical protein